MNKPVMPMSSLSLKLPTADRSIETYRLAASRTFPAKLEGTLNRVAFSAAHVVADPLADNDPWLTAAIDWDRTIAFREHIWDLGLGVAEADGHRAARHGAGLADLAGIDPALGAARQRRGAMRWCFPAPAPITSRWRMPRSIDDVIRAYEEQIAAVEKAGGRIILMASRALAKIGRNADDYAKVYNRVLSQVREPVIIHWLGDMFDPALANYWGTADLDKAMDIAVGIINANAAKVDGVKVSLLDKQREIDMRRRLDKNVKMYTGDDFNYAELIAGDDAGLFARAARHLRRHRAGGVLRAVAARGRRRSRLPRRARADGAAVAPYLQGADALLQDRHRVHGLAQRPPGSFHHGRRAGEHALDAASGRTVPAGRQGRPARQSGTGDAADEDVAGHARHRAPDAGFFCRSSLAVAEHGDGPQAGRSPRRSSTPARAMASAPSIPGATRSRRSGSTAPLARCATPGSN